MPVCGPGCGCRVGEGWVCTACDGPAWLGRERVFLQVGRQEAKRGKRRMIVRRVGGKERAETIVQLSKEAVIEGVRIWHSIFLKTLKVHRKKVILYLMECSALPRENPFCTGLLHWFSWLGQGVRIGIKRVLPVCLLGILQCNSDIVCKTRTQNHFLFSLFSPQETWISPKPEVKGHYSE